MRSNFPGKSYHQATEGLLQGPKIKKQSTIDLEAIGHAFLDPTERVSCQFNSLGELEVKVNDRIYNLTLILADNPDYEHLEFSPEEVANYAKFLQTANVKPELNGKELPSASDYQARDPDSKHNHLLLGEKLAITLYTGEYYELINDVLRTDGKTDELKSLDEGALTQTIKELVLATAIASQALNKIPSTPIAPQSEEQEKLYRYEETVNKVDLSRRNDTAHQKTTLHKSFTSTLSAPIFEKLTEKVTEQSTTKHTIIYFLQSSSPNPIGKNVAELSDHKDEEGEVLFAPGTEFKYFESRVDQNVTTFAAVPVRTYQQHTENPYVSTSATLHSEVIHFANQLNDDPNSSVNDLTYLRTLIESNDNKEDKAIESARKEIDAIIAVKAWMADNQDVIAAAQYAYDHHLSHRFKDLNLTDLDADEKFGTTTIERPNHGLSHSIRPAMYLLLLIDYFAKFAKDPKFREFASSLSANDINLIQKALVFAVSGRESEISFKQDDQKILEYREASFQNFVKYARSKNIPEEEIQKFRTIMSNDDIHWEGMGTLQTPGQYLFYLMMIAHRLDSFRYEDANEFAKLVDTNKLGLAKITEDEEQAWNKILSIASNAIQQTGDRLTCTFDGTEVIPAFKERDGKRFVPASQNAAVSFQVTAHCTAQVQSNVFQLDKAKPIPISDQKLIAWMSQAVQSGYSELFNTLLTEAFNRHIPLHELSSLINNDYLTEENILSAIEHDQANIINLMLQKNPALRALQINGVNLLSCCAQYGANASLVALIENGVNIESTVGKTGKTALIYAIEHNNEMGVTILLENKANINVTDSMKGMTPLHYAAFHGNIDIVELLLEHGANINAKDKAGNTPLSYVKNADVMVSLLLAVKQPATIPENEKKLIAQSTKEIADTLIYRLQSYAPEEQLKLWEQTKNSALQTIFSNAYQPSSGYSPALFGTNNTAGKSATVYETILANCPQIRAHESHRLKM